MHHTSYLDKRDFMAGDSRGLPHHALSTGDSQIDSELENIALHSVRGHDPVTLQNILTAAVIAARSEISCHDLQVMLRTITEMLKANLGFAPYRHIRKISIFGSARIKRGEPAYNTALAFSREAREHGYMMITGGGPGIMQACNEGAGVERSFGLNIELPFEQEANPIMTNDPKLISFYYFFIRKLNFVAESDAMVAFPGGFGTMDEIFETMTLIQTGKASIYPLILLDSPGKTFWKRWMEFIHTELVDSGLISQDDLALLHVTKSPQEAIDHIDQFYRIFHSYRFIDKQICIRLVRDISSECLAHINANFKDIIREGSAELCPALPEEADEPLLMKLPRLVFSIKRGNYGRLRQLIDLINLSE